MIYVPVVDKDGKPLMPTNPNRAASWIKTRKATPFWNRGVWCVRLNQEPSSRNLQAVSVGVDPGSKKEAFTIKSANKTFLNIQADARTGIKEKVEERCNARRSRRSRKTPYRKNKLNRKRNNGVPPSTKARWDFKLRILYWLNRIYPISIVVVEDIKAISKYQKINWNINFSPLQVGKNWFYGKIKKQWSLKTISGFFTSEIRKTLRLEKSKNKLSEDFSAHCVDSWVLANSEFDQKWPENKNILFIYQFKFSRRKLHVFNYKKNGKRKRYGSTRSLNFKRGSLVANKKYKLCLVGGTSNNMISLHSKDSNKRISQKIEAKDIQFIAYMPWFYRNK